MAISVDYFPDTKSEKSMSVIIQVPCITYCKFHRRYSHRSCHIAPTYLYSFYKLLGILAFQGKSLVVYDHGVIEMFGNVLNYSNLAVHNLAF